MQDLGWTAVGREGYSHHVEAKRGRHRFLLVQVQPGRAADASTLAGIDGLERVAALDPGSRSNLDEDTKAIPSRD